MRITKTLSIFLIILLGSCASFAHTQQKKMFFELIEQKQYEKAMGLAKKNHDQALYKIALSQSFLSSSVKDKNFEKIANFLLDNPFWPQKQEIQAVAEGVISKCKDYDLINRFFANTLPITGQGYKYYALSYLKRNNIESAKSRDILSTAWQRGSFSAEEAQDFLGKYHKFLTSKDHIKKIDYNIAIGNYSNARSLYNLLDKGYKQSFETQIALKQGKDKAIQNFKSVPSKYYTAGLIHNFLDAQKKSSPDSKHICSLIPHASYDKYFGDKIWKAQQYLAREYIEKNAYKAAYKTASQHFATSPADVSEAEFLSGWLALRFLKDPKTAIEHFTKLLEVVTTPISKARGGYWLARAHQALKNHDMAQKLHHDNATKFPLTFYGQLSSIETTGNKLAFNKIFANSSSTKTPKIDDNKMDLFKATSLISAHGSNGLAQLYIKSAVEGATNEVELEKLAKMLTTSANEHYKTHHLAWLGKYAAQKHLNISKDYTYPRPYSSKNVPIEQPLMYSIIRQESVFHKGAVSRADARGLMQLIPPTACNVAKQINQKCLVNKLVSDPHYNIMLGTNYLNGLIEDFKGSYILSIAGYNAGPHNVKKWLDRYGDPRQMSHHYEVIDWLELIPFYETRSYVQRVVENLQIYRHILGNMTPSAIIKETLLANNSR